MKLPVLLVDDDQKWLQICLARLPQTDYTLEPTAALSDALERLTTIRHPVVICDLRLIGIGERGGFELLVRAKTISEFTKVIIVTAYGGAATDIAREAMEKGAITYLTKPLDFGELDRCIIMAIQSWRQEIEEMANLGFLAAGPESSFLRSVKEDVGTVSHVQQPDTDLVGTSVQVSNVASLSRVPRRKYLARLRQMLVEYFDEEELQTLCFDLGVDYDSLPAQGKAGKARELVAYLENRARIPELIELGQQLRPEAPWGETLKVIRDQRGDV